MKNLDSSIALEIIKFDFDISLRSFQFEKKKDKFEKAFTYKKMILDKEFAKIDEALHSFRKKDKLRFWSNAIKFCLVLGGIENYFARIGELFKNNSCNENALLIILEAFNQVLKKDRLFFKELAYGQAMKRCDYKTINKISSFIYVNEAKKCSILQNIIIEASKEKMWPEDICQRYKFKDKKDVRNIIDEIFEKNERPSYREIKNAILRNKSSSKNLKKYFNKYFEKKYEYSCKMRQENCNYIYENIETLNEPGSINLKRDETLNKPELINLRRNKIPARNDVGFVGRLKSFIKKGFSRFF